MNIGTRSVLFGVHQFLLHPWFVAWAWWKLYGFPYDPRLWVAFFVHDLGYLGKPNMDGPEGERHPELGAKIIGWLFDWPRKKWAIGCTYCGKVSRGQGRSNRCPNCHAAVDHAAVDCFQELNTQWYGFVLYHSRFLAKKHTAQPSRLCIADKLAIALTPWWLYLPLAKLTGELSEYMKRARQRENTHAPVGLKNADPRIWYECLQDYMRRWVAEHRDGRTDTWTP